MRCEHGQPPESVPCIAQCRRIRLCAQRHTLSAIMEGIPILRKARCVVVPMENSGPRKVALRTAVCGNGLEDLCLDSGQGHSFAARRNPRLPPF